MLLWFCRWLQPVKGTNRVEIPEQIGNKNIYSHPECYFHPEGELKEGKVFLGYFKIHAENYNNHPSQRSQKFQIIERGFMTTSKFPNTAIADAAITANTVYKSNLFETMVIFSVLSDCSITLPLFSSIFHSFVKDGT